MKFAEWTNSNLSQQTFATVDAMEIRSRTVGVRPSWRLSGRGIIASAPPPGAENPSHATARQADTAGLQVKRRLELGMYLFPLLTRFVKYIIKENTLQLLART